MEMLIRQSLECDVQLDQETEGIKSTIYLFDADVARIIQVRYQFERFDLSDLIAALEQWRVSSGVAQVSYESLMRTNVTPAADRLAALEAWVTGFDDRLEAVERLTGSGGSLLEAHVAQIDERLAALEGKGVS